MKNSTCVKKSETLVNREEKTIAVATSKEKLNKNTHRLKQSEKINSLLKSSGCQFSTIPEMRYAIFEAWNTIKKEELKVQKKHNDKNEHIMSSSRSLTVKSYGDNKQNQALANQVLKKKENEMRYSCKSTSKPGSSAKCKKQKEKLNKDEKQGLSSNIPETYTDDEKEMIFKSWKKKKDEALKQQKALKESLEKEQKWNQLMEQENKKTEAKLAYSSWLTHKAVVSQKEKLEKLEYLHQEKKAHELKLQRDKEALEMYFLWLENKNAQRRDETNVTKARPPWIPPSKRA